MQIVVKDLLESQLGTDLEATAALIKNNIYVDDEVVSVDSEDSAVQVWNDSKSIFLKGGFELRKLKTNAAALQDEVVLDGLERVLGVPWDVANDFLFPGIIFPQEVGKGKQTRCCFTAGSGVRSTWSAVTSGHAIESSSSGLVEREDSLG